MRSSVQPPTYAVKIFLDTTSLETASSYFVFSKKYQQTKRARKAEKEKSADLYQKLGTGSYIETVVIISHNHAI